MIFAVKTKEIHDVVRRQPSISSFCFIVCRLKWPASVLPVCTSSQEDNNTPADVEDTVNASFIPNTAVMYCCNWLDWDSFLHGWFKPIPGILQFQHFKVSKTDKYHVECRKSPTAEATLIRIVKDNVGLPKKLLQSAASSAR